MTPQERQLVDDVFDRLSRLESAPRDPDAVAAITAGLRKAPNAVYALVQTVLLQDEALKRANAHIQELEQELQAGGPGEQHPAGGFLDSMRETIFGQTPRGGSVPNVRPPDIGSRPVWNSGQVMQQAQPPGRYEGAPYGQQPYGASQSPMGGGSSFLGTAAAAAAGMVGGSLLLNGIRGMMGGSRHGFGDTANLDNSSTGGDRAASQTPWSDQSGSSLARDAGINDIGSSTGRGDDTHRAGLFDTASNNDAGDNDDDRDDMDLDSDDFGGDGDSDNA